MLHLYMFSIDHFVWLLKLEFLNSLGTTVCPRTQHRITMVTASRAIKLEVLGLYERRVDLYW